MQVGGAKALHTRELKSGVDTSDEGLKAAWSQVKESSGTAPWALYTYGEGSSTKIVLDSTGEGFDNLLEKLSDDKVGGGLMISSPTIADSDAIQWRQLTLRLLHDIPYVLANRSILVGYGARWTGPSPSSSLSCLWGRALGV